VVRFFNLVLGRGLRARACIILSTKYTPRSEGLV
jgi:hypothetical protein